MNKSILIIFLLSILNSILFYDNSLGINVVLFMVGLLIFLVWVLKSNNKINNKYGLLFIIPIMLISCSLVLYNSSSQFLSGLVVPLLIIFMYIYTISPTYKFGSLLSKTCKTIFEPLTCIGKLYRITFSKLGNLFRLSDKGKSIIKAILITLPVLVIVIILLSSADMIFGKVFGDFVIFVKKLFSEDLIFRIIQVIVLFTYLGAVINYLLFSFNEKEDDKKVGNKVSKYTINLLLTSLGIIYIVFDFIQINSLILHRVSTSINYAEYARQGFFELLVIAVINLIILLITKKGNNEGDKYSKTLSIVMVFLTFIIIISSFLRMAMYQSAYGYTTLRLLVFVSLITMILLLIPTTLYILNSKINIFKHYLIILTSVYTLLCLFPVDSFIAQSNINRYYEKGKIDIFYLENYRTDNIPVLVDFYNSTTDEKVRTGLKDYFDDFYDYSFDSKCNNILEYNISKKVAEEKLNQFK